jgi:hypothetical protein
VGEYEGIMSMITRRGFMGWVVSGIATVCVATRVPLSWMPEQVKRASAEKFLTDVWAKWSKGSNKYPYSELGYRKNVYMVCSPALHDAFWEEMEHGGKTYKQVPNPNTKEFKGIKLFKPIKSGRGKSPEWWADVHEGEMVVI